MGAWILMLVAWTQAAAAPALDDCDATATLAPMLCFDGSTSVDLVELGSALRARVDPEVVICRCRQGADPTWRLWLRDVGPQRLEWILAGVGRPTGQVLNTTAMSPVDVVSVLAMAVADALRSFTLMSGFGQELGPVKAGTSLGGAAGVPATGTEPAATAAAAAAAATDGAASARAGSGIRVGLATLAGLDRQGVGFALGVEWRALAGWHVAALGGVTPAGMAPAHARASSWRVEAWAGWHPRIAWLEAGVDGGGKLCLTYPSGPLPAEAQGSAATFNVAAKLSATGWLWRLGQGELGIALEVRLWAWPRRFTMAGEEILSEPVAESLLGLRMALP